MVILTKYKQDERCFILLDGRRNNTMIMEIWVPAAAECAVCAVFMHEKSARIETTPTKFKVPIRFVFVAHANQRPKNIRTITRPTICVCITPIIQHSTVCTRYDCTSLVDMRLDQHDASHELIAVCCVNLICDNFRWFQPLVPPFNGHVKALVDTLSNELLIDVERFAS